MKKCLLISLCIIVKICVAQAQQMQLSGISNTSPVIYDINLQWISATADTVKIEYSSDNGITYSFIDYALTNANDTGQYWLFTDTLVNSLTSKVKVSNINNPSDYAESSTFQLYHAIVTYTPDLTDTTLYPGDVLNLSLAVTSYIPCSIVELYFSKDNGQTWQLVTAGNASTFANYSWTAPAITSHHCMFGFWNGWNMHYMRSPRFNIINPANPYGDDLTITYPTGNELFYAGQPLTVTWDTTALEDRTVGIMVREVNAPFQSTCLIGMANSKTGHAAIKVPYYVGNNYQIYIFSINAGTPFMSSVSTGHFSILAPYLVNNRFIDIIQPFTTDVQPGSTVSFNWNSYPGLNLVGISRHFPNTAIPAVPVNTSNLTNTGQYSFVAPLQDSVDIVVELTPYIQTASMLSGSCALTYSITFHTSALATNTNEVEGMQRIEVYPNPTASLIQISNTQTTKNMSLKNMLGQEILNQKLLNQPAVTIDLQGYPVGIYFVTLQSENEIVTRKIVKE